MKTDIPERTNAKISPPGSTTQAISLGLALMAFSLSALLYPRLPDPMPSHFDLAGRVDGYLPRALGAFLLPGVILALHLLLGRLARRARLAEGAISAPRTLEILQLALLGFLLLTHGVVLRVATGGAIGVSSTLFAALGLFLAILGNYLGKLRRNTWLGIRTPWTLSDDEIWARTHRLAGPLFVVGGAVLCMASLRGQSASVLPVALATMLGIPCAYSFVLARRPR